MTAPTCLRGHVARVATWRAMFMKYVCQSTLSGIAGIMPEAVPRVRMFGAMFKQRRVVVTGLGAVTSIGGNVGEFWKRLLEGECGIGPLSLFDASAYRTQTAAEVRE